MRMRDLDQLDPDPVETLHERRKRPRMADVVSLQDHAQRITARARPMSARMPTVRATTTEFTRWTLSASTLDPRRRSGTESTHQAGCR